MFFFQVSTAQFPAADGGLMSVVTGCPTTHNKTAATQLLHLQHARAFFIEQSDFVLSLEDFKANVTDSANNERATNRLDAASAPGPVVDVPCLAHTGVNTGRHGVLPTPNTASVACICASYDPPIQQGQQASKVTKWVRCNGCGVWCHLACYMLVKPPLVFSCTTCTRDNVFPSPLTWGEHLDFQRQVVKALLVGDYGKGAASDFRTFLALDDTDAIYMGRDVGSRFFGAWFCSSRLLHNRSLLVDFLQQKVASKAPDPTSVDPAPVDPAPVDPAPSDDASPDLAPVGPTPAFGKPGGWWKSLLDWLESESALIFLMCGTVLHGCWGKPFVQEINSLDLTVAQANPVVSRFGNNLQRWKANPEEALHGYNSKGTDQVKALSHLHISMFARLKIIFDQMSRRWLYYTKEYQHGGRLHMGGPTAASILKNTPCTSIACEAFFGTLSDTTKAMGPAAAPWQCTATAIARQNASVTVPLLEADAPSIIQQAISTMAQHGSIKKHRRNLHARLVAEKQQEEQQKAQKAQEKKDKQEAKAREREEKKREQEARKSNPRKRRASQLEEDGYLLQLLQAERTTRTGRATATPKKYVQ